MKLFVGLGNPGRKYERTRHNLGFMVLDKFINQISISDWENNFYSFLIKIKVKQYDVIFMKPLTFMNLSGNAVCKVKNFYKLDNKKIFIIHDDIDLELGKIKLKVGGSDGGHNGLKSISKIIGNDFFRIRIGVGRPEKIDVSNHVLSNFFPEEIPRIEELIIKCCSGIKFLIENKNEKCTDLFSK